MKLTWTTTASLILREGGTTIAFDPFMKLPPEEELLPLYRTARYIFVTHGHFDHIMHIPALYKKRPVTVFATETPAGTLEGLGLSKEKIQVIKPGDTIEAGPFRVTAYPSAHCRFDRKLVVRTLLAAAAKGRAGRLFRLLRLNGKYPENEETLFYEVSVSGRRLQIMGSMNLLPDVSYPTGADLLVLPFQGRSDPDSFAKGLVERLDPKAVLIDHHDDSFPPMSADIDAETFAGSSEIPCLIPESGKEYTI